MVRSSITAALLVGALAASPVACSSGSHTGAASPSSATGSAPAPERFAVLASSADPNDLDGRRADIVAALGAADEQHVVVSPGGCFTGIPQRYAALYVLGVWDSTEQHVRDRLHDAGAEAEWIGAVTSTCLD
jgi:histone acetyltransferase (RNA polymerase elongator complex component)